MNELLVHVFLCSARGIRYSDTNELWIGETQSTIFLHTLIIYIKPRMYSELMWFCLKLPLADTQIKQF